MPTNEQGPTLADQLRDKQALKAAMDELSPNEVGDLVGAVLARWSRVGDTSLVFTLRVIADYLETGRVPEDVVYYDHGDQRELCVTCGYAYEEHPEKRYGEFVLHELCGGSLVKLGEL